jgi:acyl-CoA reductase-like NAD-dependent aldehyde dehydrogenase
MKTYLLAIDGRLVAGERQQPVIDPASEEPFAIASLGSAAQMEAAIEAAHGAQPHWAAVSRAERGAKVAALADAIESQTEDLARLLTREQGKPLREAMFEIKSSVRALRWCAAFEFEPPREIPARHARIEVRRCPVGVIGCITPWNYPFLLAINKIAPALVTGNTVVLKPAPTTPLTSLELGRLALDVLPAGVLNVVADQNDLGPILTAHPLVAKISFTGSTATGQRIMRSASDGVKRITLELGGNDAAIVSHDANIEEAVAGLSAMAFLNAGQICVSPKRLYVHDSIYEKFAHEFAAAAGRLKVGPGLEEGVEMGPLQNRAQFEKVQAIIADAAGNGKILTGGHALRRRGYFIEPTVVRDISEGSRLVDEEQFGPVVPLIRFSDEADAITRANASSYGLGGSVWSKDLQRARQLAESLECGTAWINQHLDVGPEVPFAGVKQSGIGVESGRESFDEFTRVQVINARIT